MVGQTLLLTLEKQTVKPKETNLISQLTLFH